MRVILILLLILTGVSADPPKVATALVVPKPIEVQAKPGDSVILTSATSTWRLGSEAAPVSLQVSGTQCVVRHDVAGRFMVLADQETYLVIFTGEAKPPVIPPVDPPKPPVNPPADPLRDKLQALYNADTGANKAESLKDLVELYVQAQTLCTRKKKDINGVEGTDYEITQIVDLAAKVREAGALLMQAGEVKGMRDLINAEIKASFNTPGPLTPELRAKCEAKFKSICDSLKGVKS